MPSLAGHPSRAARAWPLAIAIGLLALTLGAEGAVAEERSGGVFGARAELPQLDAQEVQALRRHLATDQRGAAEGAKRSASYAPLGVPERKDARSAPSVINSNGRWLSEIGDVAEIPGFSRKEAFRAGAMWQAWSTKQKDVTEPGQRKMTWWRGPEKVPNNFQLRQLPVDWRGLFAQTSRGGIENGMSRGHIVPNAEATESIEQQKSTFEIYGNAFPQSRDSNAGAWRNFEKTVQEVARAGYHVYNYAGVLWQPHKYTRLDGSEAVVNPKLQAGKIPTPSAYWRVSIAVPTHGPNGEKLDLAEAISYARPLTVVVPNSQDSEIFVSDWARFSTSIAEVEKMTGIRLLTHLDAAPKGEALAKALRHHIDDGKNLPRETEMPPWKVAQLRQLLDNPESSSELARAKARELLTRAGQPTERRQAENRPKEARTRAQPRAEWKTLRGSERPKSRAQNRSKRKGKKNKNSRRNQQARRTARVR